eukprot:868622-Amphidinium_carterae.1
MPLQPTSGRNARQQAACRVSPLPQAVAICFAAAGLFTRWGLPRLFGFAVCLRLPFAQCSHSPCHGWMHCLMHARPTTRAADSLPSGHFYSLVPGAKRVAHACQPECLTCFYCCLCSAAAAATCITLVDTGSSAVDSPTAPTFAGTIPLAFWHCWQCWPSCCSRHPSTLCCFHVCKPPS